MEEIKNKGKKTSPCPQVRKHRLNKSMRIFYDYNTVLKTEEGEIDSSRKNGNVLISGRSVCIDTGRLHGRRDEIRKVKWE